MLRRPMSWLALTSILAGAGVSTALDDPPPVRLQRAKEFHLRAQERTGLLVPLYLYPGDVDKNPAYNRLIDLKRRYETVPIWVIVNPNSGPGSKVDPNYTRTIDRLRGAGCVVIGYVPTGYAKRPKGQVEGEVDRWLKLYPRIQGIFFDEMIYEDTAAGVEAQAALTRHSHDLGCWPIVANPGTDTPARYFAADAADVIVVHEGPTWPEEARLKGTPRTGYTDHPPFTRSVLLHSQPTLDKAALRMVRRYARWVYVTEAPYRPGDPTAPNPWDRLSSHLEAICEELK